MKKFYYWSENERYRNFDLPYDEVKNLIWEKSQNFQSLQSVFSENTFKLEKSTKEVCDFPYFNIYVPVISEKALSVLKKAIEPHTEILPLRVANADVVLYALNIQTVYDIDLFRSDYDGAWPEVGKIEDIKSISTYAFPNDVLPTASIFRLRPSQPSHIFISEELKRLIEENNLVGLEFDREMKYRTGYYMKDLSKEPTLYASYQRVVEKTKKREEEIKQEELKKQQAIAAWNESMRDYDPLTDPKNKDLISCFKYYPKQDFGPPITDEMLDEFEKNLPGRLPEDYRTYLKICNGGIMELDDDEESLYFDIQGAPDWFGHQGGLSSMFSLNIPSDCDLLETWKWSQGNMPLHFLPFGSDWGGNLTCLSLGKDDYGYVYCWNHEEAPYETDYSQSYFAAKSFTEFINSLKLEK